MSWKKKFVTNWGRLGMKFNRYALSDLATIKYGKNQKKVLSESGNIPIYGTGGLMGYATTALYDKPSVLIGRKGTIGKVKYVEHPFWTVDTLFYTIVNTDIVLPKYLYYVMSLIDLNNYNEGTTIPSLRTETLNRLEFDIPSLVEQETILSCLNPIDEKIALNNAINNNLEQQVQAIYRSWFVNYEPFDGTKPDDWSDGTIDDLGTEIICGKTPSTKKSEYYGGNTPFITIPDMHGCVYIVSTERYLSDAGVASQPKKTLPPNTVCVSCIGTAGLVTLVSEESQSNQQINSIIPKEGISVYYIYLLMQTLADTINKLGQSGSTIVNLNKTQFGKIQVMIPSELVLQDFDSLCRPLFDTILSNQKENINLSELRDALLPKLMSSELDVSDIDL